MKVNYSELDDTCRLIFLKAIGKNSIGKLCAIMNKNDEYGNMNIVFSVNGIELNFMNVFNFFSEEYDNKVIIEANKLVKEKIGENIHIDSNNELYKIGNMIFEIRDKICKINDSVDKTLSSNISRLLRS